MKTSNMLYQFWIFVAFFLSWAVTQKAEEVHYMSTHVDPKDFTKDKIDSHEVGAFNPDSLQRRRPSDSQDLF
jgi:hypothetical protein